MAYNTFPTFIVEFPNVASQPLNDGLFGLFNNTTGYALEVRKVDARFSGQYGATDIPKLTWNRITALSGGTSVTASKRNSTASSLPVQVLARTYASDIQATTTDLFRTIDELPGSIGIEAAGFSTTPLSARLSGRDMTTGALLWHAGQPGGGTRAETIILREGEGISLNCTQVGIPHSMWFSMMIRVVATTRCYDFPEILINPVAEQLNVPVFALFNGSGSGVVIEVRVSKISPLAGMDSGNTSTAIIPPPNMRLALIDGWLNPPDVTYTPVALNTQRTLPSGFTFGSGFTSLAKGWNDGHPVEWMFYHGGWLDEPTNSVVAAPLRYEQSIGRVRQHTQASWFSGPTGPNLMFPGPETIWDCRGGDGILIKPGQGFAGLAGGAFTNGGYVIDNNTLSQWVFRVTFVIKQLGADLSGLGGTYVS